MAAAATTWLQYANGLSRLLAALTMNRPVIAKMRPRTTVMMPVAMARRRVRRQTGARCHTTKNRATATSSRPTPVCDKTSTWWMGGSDTSVTAK